MVGFFYVKEKNMEIPVICEKCGNKFIVSKNKLQNKEYTLENGMQVKITSYDCPQCSKRHFVQVDSQETENILRDCLKEMALLTRYKKKNQDAPKKHVEKFKKLRSDLSESRNNLMKQVSGKNLICIGTNELVDQIQFSA